MGPLAIFGIENDALSTIVSLLVLFLIAVYIALVFWTYSDAKRRVADPLLVSCATVASLFPFVGTIVYVILRPPEYLEDVRERELEIAAAEARLVQLHDLACPHCSYPVERAFLRCPSCLRRLKEPCASCRKPLDPRWKICPYCEAEVGQAQPQRRRRRTAAAGAPAQKRPQPRPQSNAGAKGAPARTGEPGDGAPPRARPAAGGPAEPPTPRSAPPTG